MRTLCIPARLFEFQRADGGALGTHVDAGRVVSVGRWSRQQARPHTLTQPHLVGIRSAGISDQGGLEQLSTAGSQQPPARPAPRCPAWVGCEGGGVLRWWGACPAGVGIVWIFIEIVIQRLVGEHLVLQQQGIELLLDVGGCCGPLLLEGADAVRSGDQNTFGVGLQYEAG